MRNKKKFKDTTVGKVLATTLGLINPNLGNLVQGTGSVTDLIDAIKGSDASPEEKAKAQEIALNYYEAEVHDRIAARQREATVAASGGSDLLFKIVGAGITLAFLGMVLTAMGLIDYQPENQRMFDLAFGAVTAKMTSIVSYYFGSSQGSKQKTDLLNGSNRLSN